jgi:peroxiredoxin Q/BCP
MHIGTQLSNLPFEATSNLKGHLIDFQGQWLVLFFYPKDATSGCTLEGQDFRDKIQAFSNLNARVFGISRDNLKAHERFKEKEQFPFELISDPEEALCKHFDVMKLKSIYGKQVRGIERSTFLFDPEGVLRFEWRKVKVPGHVEEVLTTLKNLALVNVHTGKFKK